MAVVGQMEVLAHLTSSEARLVKGEICGPHCDARVLHAPGTCSMCDEFPLLQRAREIWGIAFTGEEPGDRLPCPAETQRSASRIHEWPGNRPEQWTPGVDDVERYRPAGPPNELVHRDGTVRAKEQQ